MPEIIKVKKATLIEAISKNRDEHRELFLQAQAGFRERMIEELDEMLRLARSGDTRRLHVALVPPEDHTSDYNRALAMLEMDVTDVVDVSQHEFSTLVLNQWEWSARAAITNSTYATGGKISR